MSESSIAQVEETANSVRIVALVDDKGDFTPEGENRLKSALSKSDGKAVLIVHPFFPDADPMDPNHPSLATFYPDIDPNQHTIKDDPDYASYKESLKRYVSRYKSLGLPLILFEEKKSTDQIPSDVEHMGISDGEIFVVPTQEGGAWPADIKFSDLVRQLSEIGLKRASVSGTYLSIIHNHPGEYIHESFPLMNHKVKLSGCVGTTIESFLGRIRTTPGLATYPPRKKQTAWAENI